MLQFVRAFLAALAAITALCAAAKVDAAQISYSLMLCENLSVLQNPNNKMVADLAAMNTQHVLLSQRTTPYLELKNTSDAAEITQLTIQLANTAVGFDWASFVKASPGVTATLSSPMGNSAAMTFSFTGLTPGSSVFLRTGLGASDPSTTNPIFDYRMALFHLNGTDTSKNASVNVAFKDGPDAKTLTDTMPNFKSVAPSPTTLLFICDAFAQDHVSPFSMTGQGTQSPGNPDEPPPPAVPEPSSFALLGAGLLAMAVLSLTRTRPC